jgi:thiamine monophosphate synthase
MQIGAHHWTERRMTTLPGFDRPVDLYECANAHGVHVGSMDKLWAFAAEIQRRAVVTTTTKDEKEKAE